MEIAVSVSARLVSCLTLLFLCNRLRYCLAADTIVPGQSISGEQTLVSAGEKFVLGFFSPGNSRNRYLGIWFKVDEPRSVIWVANRENPITDTFPGVLKFSNDGNLTVLDGNQNSSTLWSTTSSVSAKRAKLLDTGNLVLIDGDENSERFLWQSFDYPTDTYVRCFKFGRNLKTGHIWSLTSWKSSNDPSPGNFTYGMDLRGLPQLGISKGHGMYYSSGPWNGHIWSGIPTMGRDYIGNYSFIRNGDEVYYLNNPNNSIIPFKLVMDKSGMLQYSTWSEENRVWTVFWSAPKGPCQFYGACGTFGVCNVDNIQRCTCLQGFKPKSQQNWDLSDWSGGCVRKTELKCGDEDGFFRLIGMKLPDVTTLDPIDENLSLQECKAKCLNNCSCRAFAMFGARGAGSGCAIWSVDLMDLEEFSVGGEEFYLRVASSELGPVTREGSSTKRRRTLAIAIGSFLLGLLLLVIWSGCYMGKEMKKSKIGDGKDEDDKKSWEFPLFKFGVIEAATNSFSQANKVGEGGFGPVYKGKLPNGQEIAVKRLSKYSGQGVVEFENEVILTARLQHRNLVRLLGYCTHKEEKILIYEYMPNRGLDSFLFDQSKSALLDWKKRFNIIVGIARGILYLHQDSRLRVIHRDLKSGNILLDADMSPKISDFGMARSFGRNQVQANTRKVVGTYGYMSPEYAIRGVFSEKSDVFSFGVLVLEIVSGKKISGFCHLDESLSLSGYAWKLWQEGRGLELMDPSLGDSCPKWQVLRCIHLGLLCVQESPKDRPNMSSIVSMLGSETDLSAPKKPAFSIISDPDSNSLKSCSLNSVTITLIEAR